MRFARLLPIAILVAITGLLAAPVGIALHMTADPTGPDPGQTRSRTKARAHVSAGFDGDRAYRYLIEQCNIGPRFSGTDGNLRLRHRLAEHFRSCRAEVVIQAFPTTDPLTGGRIQMANVLGRWYPERTRRVLIGAHFDTRPRPDKEIDPRRRRLPFLGANDGASGVAVLMELAHMLPELQTSAGVDLVAFDGEELVYDTLGEYFLGSRYFAQQYRQTAARSGYRYVAAIVVDMVADKRLQIHPDQLSARRAPQLVEEVWAVARRLRARAFRRSIKHDIRDDHEPLLEAGIPAIDIIDFDYPHWHRAADTPDKCSPASLAQVGGVVAEWLRGQ